jgi:hypothetical protein
MKQYVVRVNLESEDLEKMEGKTKMDSKKLLMRIDSASTEQDGRIAGQRNEQIDRERR